MKWWPPGSSACRAAPRPGRTRGRWHAGALLPPLLCFGVPGSAGREPLFQAVFSVWEMRRGARRPAKEGRGGVELKKVNARPSLRGRALGVCKLGCQQEREGAGCFLGAAENNSL